MRVACTGTLRGASYRSCCLVTVGAVGRWCSRLRLSLLNDTGRLRVVSGSGLCSLAVALAFVRSRGAQHAVGLRLVAAEEAAIAWQVGGQKP